MKASALILALMTGIAAAPAAAQDSAPAVVADSADSQLYAQDRRARTSFDQAAFNRTFRHETMTVNGGTRIHYVVGGAGPPLLLLHGFPQTWLEWRLIMPALAEAGYTVIAPGLRRFGDSDKPLSGYDAGLEALALFSRRISSGAR